MRILTCPPGTETRAINVKAYFSNLREEQVAPVSLKYGLKDIDPEGWDPTENFLGALNELAKNPDYLSTVVAVGLEIGMITPVAPGVENPSIEDVLMGWDAIYQYLHRNGDAGKIVCEKINDKHYKL